MKKNIYDVLKQDHDEVKSLLNQLSNKKDYKLFKELQLKVVAHNEAEEEVFYEPLQKKAGKLKIMVKAGHEEHDLTMEMMKQISQLDNDEEYQALFQVIKKSLEAHIKMEEEDLFKLAEKHFSAKEAEEMATEMAQAKKEVTESMLETM